MNFTMNPSDVVCIDRIHIFIRQIDTMNNIREEDIDKTSEDYPDKFPIIIQLSDLHRQPRRFLEYKTDNDWIFAGKGTYASKDLYTASFYDSSFRTAPRPSASIELYHSFPVSLFVARSQEWNIVDNIDLSLLD